MAPALGLGSRTLETLLRSRPEEPSTLRRLGAVPRVGGPDRLLCSQASHQEQQNVNEYLDKLRSVGVISRRTGQRVEEGRDIDSGQRWKATTDELNNTVTERSSLTPSGVTERQDVHLRPETVKGEL